MLHHLLLASLRAGRRLSALALLLAASTVCISGDARAQVSPLADPAPSTEPTLEAGVSARSRALADVRPLPPLDVVLDAAHAHSPRLRNEAAVVRRYASHLESMRARWMDNVTVGVQSTYGSYGSALVDELSVGSQASVGVRLSLYDLFGRRHDVRAQEAQLVEVRELAAVARLEEERFVTGLYHKATLAEDLVAVRTEALQTARSHYLMAERAFGQGHVSIADLAHVSQVKAAAEAAYETARYEYRNAYDQLEIAVGRPLHELVRPVAGGAPTSEPSASEAPGADDGAPPDAAGPDADASDADASDRP